MPGILKMSNSVNGGLGARDVDSKKRSHDGKMVNGERTVVRQDSPAIAPAVNAPGNSMNGAIASHPMPNKTARSPPPEIEHIDSSAYHSLSKLISRITQECYNELCETLTQMNELKVPQTNGMTNGIGLPNAQDAEVNRQKKLMVLKFAHDNRAKFIKLLVLTEWGKKASADISKLIDLFSWTRKQNDISLGLDGVVEVLKRESSIARQSNPDIRTALEILGKKKAEWIPDVWLPFLEVMTSLCFEINANFVDGLHSASSDDTRKVSQASAPNEHCAVDPARCSRKCPSSAFQMADTRRPCHICRGRGI